MRKLKSPKKKKFRLLLDSAFAKPEVFVRLKRKANLAHIAYNYGLSRQAEDQEIYMKAQIEKRFVLTINFKDFRRLVKKDGYGVFGIDSELSNEQIDKLVTNFLSGKNPDDFMGKAVRI